MDKKQKMVPKLRFPGFTDDWEQRKLVDLFETACSGGTPTSSVERYYDGEIPFLGIADITGRTINETKKHISEEGLNNSNAVMIPPGSISLAMYASVGKVGITNVPMATSQAFYNMTFSSIPTRDFVYTVLEKMEIFSEWEPLISTGTQRNLNAEKVKNLLIKVPSKNERKQIGIFFQNLDTLITLHQRKLDQMKNYKQGMLQKMFPKNGEHIPEIRFPGFTDAWEQRKLGEVLAFQNGFNGEHKAFGEGVPLISVMDILNNQFISYDVIRGKATVTDDEYERYAVRYGDVLFQRSSENVEDAGSTNVYIDTDKTAIFGGFVIRGKQIYPYRAKFMKYLLDTKTVRNQITKKAQGAQHINVSQESLHDVTIKLPSEAEQLKIETCLYDLDNLITLHQRKLDQVKEYKKGLLQQMFV